MDKLYQALRCTRQPFGSCLMCTKFDVTRADQRLWVHQAHHVLDESGLRGIDSTASLYSCLLYTAILLHQDEQLV